MSHLKAVTASPVRCLFGFEIDGQRDQMYGVGPNREEAESSVLNRLRKRFPLTDLPSTLQVLEERPC